MQEGNFWKDVEGSENHWGAGESDLENRTTKEAGESWTKGTTAEAGVHWGLSITGCEGRSGGWEGAPHSQSPVPAPLAVPRWGQGDLSPSASRVARSAASSVPTHNGKIQIKSEILVFPCQSLVQAFLFGDARL